MRAARRFTEGAGKKRARRTSPATFSVPPSGSAVAIDTPPGGA